MPRIQRLLMGLVLVISLNGCTKLCADNCQQSNQRCLALNTQLIHQLKAQEQNFNAWAQEIYHNRDYKERQASIVKGCDVLIPVCTDAMTKEGRELIALGFGGLDSGWVWSLGLLKLTVLMGLCIGLIVYFGCQMDKTMSNQQAALRDIEHKRAVLALEEAEIDRRSKLIDKARAGLAEELRCTQSRIDVNNNALKLLNLKYEAHLLSIDRMRAEHDELKMQIELMNAIRNSVP